MLGEHSVKRSVCMNSTPKSQGQVPRAHIIVHNYQGLTKSLRREPRSVIPNKLAPKGANHINGVPHSQDENVWPGLCKSMGLTFAHGVIISISERCSSGCSILSQSNVADNTDFRLKVV